MILRKECAICSGKLDSLYVVDKMPIKLLCGSESGGDCSPMSFSICQCCNTIQLDRLIPLDILYSSSHNTVSVGKIWDNYFEVFCNKVGDIVEGKVVLEIGDPSGRVACALDNYKDWYIVEPNKNESVQWKENVHFIEGFFDESFSLGFSVDCIIHSHVFEHMYSPNAFLKKCWDVLKEGGEMFFGIPNMDYISQLDLAPCSGVFFEHTIFMNKENIEYLLKRNGFNILSVYDYENHSILYHVEKCIIHSIIELVPITNYKGIFLDSVEKWKGMIRLVDDSMDTYIFGASYNSQYLLTLGMSERKIKGILDNCKEKQGKYLYGYSFMVYPPSIICEKKCCVIVKNGYYSNEIIDQLLQLNPDIIIIK